MNSILRKGLTGIVIATVAALAIGSEGCKKKPICDKDAGKCPTYQQQRHDDNEWNVRPGINSNGDPTLMYGPEGPGIGFDLGEGEWDMGYGM